MKKRSSRRWGGLLAMLMVMVLLAADMAPLASAKVTQADINKLKNESSALDKKQAEVEARLKELANDKKQVLQRRDLLDSQIANTSAQISNVESQIQNYNQLIAQSEAELADAVEVTRQTIISLENGRYNASLLLAHKIARYFDLTIEDVFLFEEE